MFAYDPNSGDWFEFAQDGTPDPTVFVGRGTDNTGIGVDSDGNLYKVVGAGNLEQFGPSGSDIGDVSDGQTGSEISGFAIDPATNDVYADDQRGASGSSLIRHYAGSTLATCVPANNCGSADSFGSANLSGTAAGVAFNPANELVYVADPGNNDVAVFTPGLVPDVTTGAATGVATTTATVNGTVNPDGTTLTDCRFDYGPTTSYGQTAPCSSTPSGSSPVAVSASLTGLTPGTTYHFRVVAANSAGPNLGADLTFSTSGPATVDSESKSSITATTATLQANINPHGFDTTYHFEYGPTTSYGSSLPVPDTDIGSGFGDQSVSQSISGLQLSTTYHFRVVATSSQGTVDGPDQTFTTEPAALIDGQSVGGVQVTGATLTAQINPLGLDTTYHFEYGTTTSYGTEFPVPDADIGSGSSDVAVSQPLQGLQGGTTYHYRVIATNSAGTADGPDQTFTTFSQTASGQDSCPNAQFRTGYGAQLPDCRAYEQVTPVDKDGTDPEGGTSLVQASPSGDGITFFTQSGFPGASGAGDYPMFLARRGSGSWSTTGMMPPQSYGQIADVLGWTPDLSYSFSEAADYGASGFEYRFLGQASGDGAIDQLASGDPQNNLSFQYAYAGASSDASEVFFEARAEPLTANAAAGADNLYVWDRATGTLSLVGVLPDGSTPAGGSSAGPYGWFGSGAGGAEGQYYTQADHAISADGSRVYFTAGGTDQLYLRENPTSQNATTVEVSASQKTNGTGPGGTDPNGPQPAVFLAASADGSVVYFMSSEELTNDANTGSADQGSDLYRYDAVTGQLTDLTPDTGDPNGAGVQGLVGVSDDGSYVYFVANGDLDGSGSATPGNCSGTGLRNTSGTCNLYVWHDGTIKFISQLDANTAADDVGFADSSDASDWAPTPDSTSVPVENSARVTPDGQTLLFQSRLPLTGYDNTANGVCSDLFSSSECEELYLYRADTGKLQCVSCDPSGAAPVGSANLQSPTILAQPQVSPASILTRNLSDDGNRVFFDSPDPLVARDTNASGGCQQSLTAGADGAGSVPSCQDVYEWEADGAGSCQSTSQDGGCIYLLSSGSGANPAFFGDASASGNDVFLFTDQQLVPGDQDDLYDIYDARVDGGVASQNQTPSPPCTGEACQGQATAPPGVPSIASVTFTGPGNPAAARSARATVRVTRKRVSGSRFTLTVKVPGRGRITATGTGVGTVRRSVAKGGSYQLGLSLTARAKTALARKRTLTVSVRVAFAPAVGGSASVRMRVNLRQPNNKFNHVTRRHGGTR